MTHITGVTTHQRDATQQYVAPAVPDAPARERILTDLDTNFLVEAGAGSGKTTLLVGRMCALVARGTPVESIAAVTFTRKAANELRERFQASVEAAIADPHTPADAAAHYERALHNLDRAFLGTIHSFCGRILRERPLEIPLDPHFQELDEETWDERTRNFWRRWVEETNHRNDSDVLALADTGIDPQLLFDSFTTLVQYPDVDFETTDVEPPDAAPCREVLGTLLARADQLIPREKPADGWDSLMQLVRRLQFQRTITNWNTLAHFCAAIEGISTSDCKLTQKRWSATSDGKAAAKQLGQDFQSFLEGPAANLLRCWREHRYPIVMRYLKRATDRYARERHETGQLGFEDLLVLTARLLRNNPNVRNELGNRYRHLLVDEFQDTDPVQAEVCLLLASAPEGGADARNDWRNATPRPGALFVVGDPKQSIYRFRRADIQIYQFVKTRMQTCGAVLALTANFRSVSAIGDLVNHHFVNAFGAEATDVQAAFSPMRTVKPTEAHDGVYQYTLVTDRSNAQTIIESDANHIASWITHRIATGEHAPGDFLILTREKKPIGAYASALSARNIPVVTTGAFLPQERELRELLIVLQALGDPENTVAVAAALEGLFFGHSPADLFTARQQGLRFNITHPPANDPSPEPQVSAPVTPEEQPSTVGPSVGLSLRQLHEWWKMSQRQAADVLIERILHDTGLLLHAASQPLGEARAGALLHLVEVLRGTPGAAGGVAAAMDRIAVLLRTEITDTPLRPGRTDAVRVMNLHKAKGLEGTVVILAAPLDQQEHDASIHVVREPTGRAYGGLCVTTSEGYKQLLIAHPTHWDAMLDAERRASDAENARLLYVAVTRARRELLIVRRETHLKSGIQYDASPWSKLAPSLAELATGLQLTAEAAAGQKRMERDVTAIRDDVMTAGQCIATASIPSFHRETVTESVKDARIEYRSYDIPMTDGAAWGRVIHRTLEAMGNGRRGAALDRFINAVVADEGLTSEYIAHVHTVLTMVQQSSTWDRLTASGTAMFELPLMQAVADDTGAMQITEGVIDAVDTGTPTGQTSAPWHIVDWKTDAIDDQQWKTRAVQYQQQVEKYCEMLASLTGHPVTGSLQHITIPHGKRTFLVQ